MIDDTPRPAPAPKPAATDAGDRRHRWLPLVASWQHDLARDVPGPFAASGLYQRAIRLAIISFAHTP